MAYLLIIAATFGVMFLLDKGLTKLFRNRDQHRSGTAVRLKKHYGIFSLAMMILGVLGLLTWFSNRSPALLLGGVLVTPGGILLGIIETFSKAYLSTQFSDAIVFLVLIVILLVKPSGLLGKTVQEKV